MEQQLSRTQVIRELELVMKSLGRAYNKINKYHTIQLPMMNHYNRKLLARYNELYIELTKLDNNNNSK